MKLFSRAPKTKETKTSDVVMFNYQRPTRARHVALGMGGSIWLVEMLDAYHGVWVWQDECEGGEQALEEAKRLSLKVS